VVDRVRDVSAILVSHPSLQGDRYSERVALQDEHYLEIRDGLRNARKKKDGKLDQTIPAKIVPATRYFFCLFV
jgi:hypothetical protein